eukprot:scaffold24315_cov33-Prasinocladus_malaysianus.AAC.1
MDPIHRQDCSSTIISYVMRCEPRTYGPYGLGVHLRLRVRASTGTATVARVIMFKFKFPLQLRQLASTEVLRSRPDAPHGTWSCVSSFFAETYVKPLRRIFDALMTTLMPEDYLPPGRSPTRIPLQSSERGESRIAVLALIP